MLRAAAVVGAIAAAAVCPAGATAQVGAADARDIALDYVRDNAGDLGTTRADVTELTVMSSFRSSHNRVTHVTVNQRLGAGWARFGPPATTTGTSGPIVLVTGRGSKASRACGQLDSLPAGAIAVVDAGASCDFLEKVHNAEAAGATAVIVANDQAGNPPILGGSFEEAPPTIPAVSVTLEDGAAIKAALPASGTVRKHPNHPGIRDGDLENGIIVHEYCHGVSNRLTGGLKTQNCLTGNEQAGEGWSDYLAITLLLDPALDDPDGPRGMGPYALSSRTGRATASVRGRTRATWRSSRSRTTASRPAPG